MQHKPPTRKQLNTFVFGLILILAFFAWKAARLNNTNLSFILLCPAWILLIFYLIRSSFVIKFYQVWMRCAVVIGILVTGILMIVIFYFIFTPVGLFLRLIRKDILNLNKNPKLKTYWIDKPQREFNKSDYERQF